jgi:hypothetical protein
MRKCRIDALASWLFVPCALLAACGCGATTTARGPAEVPDTPGPQVMGWVPAYGIEQSLQSLEALPGMGRALTRIGLQFWNPGPDGRTLVFAPVDASGRPVSPADVERLQRWARAHRVQTFLTVYNNSQVINRWDWPMARRAFVDHRDEFVAAIVAAVDTWHFEGVDVDFEGEGDFEADRASYAAFVAALSTALKARGKRLTVDSFHSPCDNAPNMRWWADWRGQVDAIHTMGYADLYEGSTQSFKPEGKPVCENGAALFRYSWQLQYGLQAGYRRDQIVMGMPTWVDAWGSGGLGTTAADHLREVRALGAGVALWDLQLQAPGWSRASTWEAVRAVRHPAAAAPELAGGRVARVPMMASQRAR